MKSPRIDIGSIRREQIVEAAIAVIAEKGLHNLSLSEVENKAGMSRGQLTYYLPTKEAILLAVFDRVLQLMHERVGRPDGQASDQTGGWEWVQHLITKLLGQPPPNPVFPVLQYTFLAQIGQREDFRRRLAELYEQWRTNLSMGLAADAAARRIGRAASPRAMATVVQALLHGLAMQAAADPNAFDRDEMLDLCLDLLGTYLQVAPRPRSRRRPTQHTAPMNGSNTHRTGATEGQSDERP
jgi:AcrR family transcriptional regulator